MEKENNKKVKVLDYIINLIHRYEKGTATKTERQALDTWEPSTETMDKDIPDPKILTELNKDIWYRLDKQYKLDEHGNKRNQSFIHHLWTAYRQYAAIIFILLMTGSAAWFLHQDRAEKIQTDKIFYANDERQIWTTENTSQTKLTLADGTVVQMNEGSRMEILKHRFNKEEREVWLSGEAFFEVAKDVEKPFIIHTGDIKTIVRGTSFNVKAYDVLDENVITVRSGKVEVEKGGLSLGILTTNRELKYSKIDATSKIENTDWQDAAGWTEGRLVLNGIGAEELKLRLHQQFKVEVLIEGTALEGKYLQGTFGKGASLEEVMNTISVIYNIHYMIEKNRLIITP